MDSESDISESVGNLRMSLRERPRKVQDDIRIYDEDSMDKSNSAPSNKRKLKRRITYGNKSGVYDETGCIRYNGVDMCDCMSIDCKGCWFECENCGSTKCGIQCRVNRKVYYECITFDGRDVTIKNPHFPQPANSYTPYSSFVTRSTRQSFGN